MVDSVELFVRAVKEESITNPGNNSFNVVDQALSDTFLTVKLHYLFSVANQLVPFLSTYQTDARMVCFYRYLRMYLDIEKWKIL